MEQKAQALKIGNCSQIIDIPFPNIPPQYSLEEVIGIAAETLRQITEMTEYNVNETVYIHIMGEACFAQAFVSMLPLNWIPLHSTTERNTVENNDGTKTVRFSFVQFRKYMRTTSYHNHYANYPVYWT